MNSKNNFKKIDELINSEGTILSLLERIDEGGHLYVQGLCLNNTKIYTKVNNSQLGLYLRGRITLRELFCLREDEGYLIGKANNLETVFIDDNKKDSKIMDSLQCGRLFYPEIAIRMRGNITVDEIMERVNSKFIRGLAEVPESQMTESRYLKI